MNEVLQMNVISPAVVVAPAGVVDLALVALSVDPNAVPSTDETVFARGDDDGAVATHGALSNDARAFALW